MRTGNVYIPRTILRHSFAELRKGASTYLKLCVLMLPTHLVYRPLLNFERVVLSSLSSSLSSLLVVFRSFPSNAAADDPITRARAITSLVDGFKCDMLEFDAFTELADSTAAAVSRAFFAFFVEFRGS